jgi:hypothetical protein
MKKANPFAKLGAVDQKLYQDTTPQPSIKTNENASKLANQISSKPASWKASILEVQRASNMAKLELLLIPPLQKKLHIDFILKGSMPSRT